MNQTPLQNESTKKVLNPAIIRQDMKKASQKSLFATTLAGLILIAVSVVLTIRLVLTAPEKSDASSLFTSALPYAACLMCGVAVIVYAVIHYRRAEQNEILIEQDTVSYVEQDGLVTVRNSKHIRNGCADLLHFKSGRKLQVERYRYREADDEVFLTVALAAEPDRILRIYRLKDYDWQE